MTVQGIKCREAKLEEPLLRDVEVLQHGNVFVDRLGAAELRDSERGVPVRHVGGENEGCLIELGDTGGNRIAGVPGWVDQRYRVAGAGRKTGSRIAGAKQVLVGRDTQ